MFSISAMCRVLRVHPSGFYAWLKNPLSKRSAEDQRQTKLIKEAWEDSGEVYGYRTDPKQPPEVRAGVTPRTQADKPVGEWNRFEITMRGERLTVVLNGKKVIENAQLPGIPPRGRIALQHHGGFRDGKYRPSSSLVQFKNVFIKELSK